MSQNIKGSVEKIANYANTLTPVIKIQDFYFSVYPGGNVEEVTVCYTEYKDNKLVYNEVDLWWAEDTTISAKVPVGTHVLIKSDHMPLFNYNCSTITQYEQGGSTIFIWEVLEGEGLAIELEV